MSRDDAAHRENRRCWPPSPSTGHLSVAACPRADPSDRHRPTSKTRAGSAARSASRAIEAAGARPSTRSLGRPSSKRLGLRRNYGASNFVTLAAWFLGESSSATRRRGIGHAVAIGVHLLSLAAARAGRARRMAAGLRRGAGRCGPTTSGSWSGPARHPYRAGPPSNGRAINCRRRAAGPGYPK